MKFMSFKKTLAGVVFIFGVSPAFAAVTCSENVSNILIYGNGYINIKHTGSNTWTYICSLKEEWKGVSVPTCAIWVATLQNAKKEDNKLFFYYPNSPDYTSCADLPRYGAATPPIYIGDNI